LTQYQEVHFEPESDTFFSHRVGFASDLVPVETFNDRPYPTSVQNLGWGLSSWGDSPWGDEGPLSASPLIVSVPADYARARRFHVLYRHHVATEKVALSQIAVKLRAISLRSNVKAPRVTS